MADPLRVLITINCRWWNASAAIAVGQARALAERGHTVLLQTSRGAPAGTRAESHGIAVRLIDLREKSLPLAGMLRFRSLVRSFAPDVICCHRGPGHIAAVLASGGVPVIRVRSDIRKPRPGLFTRFATNRTVLSVYPSPFMLRDRSSYLPPSVDRIGGATVIPHCVDTSAFTPGTAGSDSRVLLALGRLSPMKGYVTLLRAASVMEGDARVVIAGASAQYDAERLRAIGSSLGLDAGRLEFKGEMDDVLPLLRSATLGVVPSLGSEVVSRTCLEMMSCGIVVLGAATNGLLDQIRDGVTGLIHPPGDWKTLARQADWLLSNPEVRNRMGSNARSVCESEYSLEAVGSVWESCLTGLVS
jgi:glycosyltransferase involved in cell wall biosynthesis